MVPAVIPAVTTWKILPPRLLVAVHNTDVSDFHSEASLADIPIILASVLSECPRLKPATVNVDGMDIVDAIFDIDNELNTGSLYDIAVVKDPVDLPDVSST
jgi:hypothetical protein